MVLALLALPWEPAAIYGLLLRLPIYIISTVHLGKCRGAFSGYGGSYLTTGLDGKIWAGSASGVDYWNGSSWTSTGTPPNFSGSSVSALTTEANGYIWASSRSGYVDYWNGSSWISTGQPPTATGRTILYATALTYGPNNTVWVGVTDNDSTCYVDYWNGSSWLSAGTPTNFNYYVECLPRDPTVPSGLAATTGMLIMIPIRFRRLLH